MQSAAQQAQSSLRLKLEAQRESFARRGAPGYRERIGVLETVLHALLANREKFVQAISDDFGGRAREETLMLEIFPLADEIRHTKRNLKRWMRPRRVAADWAFFPATAGILYQPLGVVGIIGAWNYPLMLTISPVVAALAAGNHVMLKPSELAPRTAELIAETFSGDRVEVVTGGPDVAEAFSALPFDHLLFTGSAQTGRCVMRAASENLTPVTLELGGKSPVLIHSSYPLRRAVERILAGKLYNAGQTCLAPDYVLLPEALQDRFVALAREIASKMYPRLVDNQAYTRIINARHYERLIGLVENARSAGAEITEINPAGELCGAANRVMPPTLVRGVSGNMRIVQEEIFGPVLPIVACDSLDDAIEYVNERPRPLALYYFDHDSGRIDRVLRRTISGGVTINDVLFHVAQKNLPFGGVGASGMGQYRGFHGFETFSKKKGVFRQSRFSPAHLFRPPYGKRVEKMIQLMIGR